jgi:uncharacterized protein YbaP (TraB family)
MNRWTPIGRRLAFAVAILLGVVSTAASPLAQSKAPTRGVLWKASNSQGVVYLVGSVHLLTKDYYPLSPTLDAAFNESDLLVEEIDLGDTGAVNALQLMTRSQLPAGESLDTLLGPTDYARVSKRFAGLGLPIEALRQFKPWTLALMLSQLEWAKAGFDPALGLDQHFFDRAKKSGKAVRGLETVEFQLSRFDGLPLDQQARLLVQTIDEIESETANVVKLVDAWKTGDVVTLEKMAMADIGKDPFLYNRFLVERNRNWMPVIESLFNRPGRAFVVVGAAHLIGPDGLVQMLEAKGYRVEQL